MKKFDLLGGLIWVIVGISFCAGSVDLKFGSLKKPGPGFLPFLSGVFLGLLGAILLLSSVLNRLEEEKELNGEKIWVIENWKMFLFTLLALFGYVLLLDLLGFLITTFIFLFFLFKITEPKKWLLPVFFSGVTVILSYLFFHIWLNVQFPKGIFKF
jgi:putative tricarboxylic transport membrane protein